MFKRISHIIAVQFTAFVFALFLVNGVIFLAADFTNAQRDSHMRLERTIRSVAEVPFRNTDTLIRLLPPPVRERVRIVDMNGEAIYTGTFFGAIPFSPVEGFSDLMIDGEQYSILTARILNGGNPVGYLQAADIERFQRHELPRRAFLYLLVSAIITALTYVAGRMFARTSLRPAARMVEKLEQFTQDASHELRTPLATLNSSLDVALKTGKYKEGLESAKEDVKEISILIERLLEMASMDTLTMQKQKIDLSGLILQIIERHRLLPETKQVTINAHLAPDVSVFGDASMLREVVINLLSNAVKFNKPQGTIDVFLTPKQLRIKDTGIGIPSEALPHIFDRFYQVNQARCDEGCGLGLALVKRIIDLHNWTIDVKSKEHEGTEFNIAFHK
jgi:signal transduction histidine kinase